MKRWLVIITVGSGYTQKYAPDTFFFKTKRHAEDFLRSKIKTFVLSHLYYDSIKEFLSVNDIYDFEINGEHFFLKEVEFE